jgi:hypothetical protein
MTTKIPTHISELFFFIFKHLLIPLTPSLSPERRGGGEGISSTVF